MAKILGTIFKELRRGENLDLYLTVLLAVVIAIFGILQIASFEIISAAILGTLGLLASSLITNRRASAEAQESFDKLVSNIKSLQDRIGRKTYISELLSLAYPDLTEEIRTAKRVSVEGSTLGSTATRYFAEFTHLLQRGGELRILVSEPTPEVLAMQVFRSSSIKDPAMMTASVNSNVAMMKSLGDKISHPELFEIRTMPYIASYSLAIIEGADGIKKAYVKLLSVQKPEAESPSFELHSRYDEKWFEFFSDQFEKMWTGAYKV